MMLQQASVQRANIESALKSLSSSPLAQGAIARLGVLGYHSSRIAEMPSSDFAGFQEVFLGEGPFRADKALVSDWKSIDFLFQYSDEEIKETGQQALLEVFASQEYDKGVWDSFAFFAIDLTGEKYTRTQLAEATRAINRPFSMPVIVLFRHSAALTLAVIHRRLHKKDENKDVLEKVTLIKDVLLQDPHRAHIEILFDLTLSQLAQDHQIANFASLHRAWQKALDAAALNKKFYKELADWYFWALSQVTFPPQAGAAEDVTAATSVIRLITRLMFTWFLKERGLVPDALFRHDKLSGLLNDLKDGESTYYKAILQNLFFATLNTEMDDPARPRRFRGKNPSGGRNSHHGITNVCRYEDAFQEPAKALELFAAIPFLNGGLFECLDRPDEATGKRVLVDGFSERPENPLRVPNSLFFSDEQKIDLNAVYGTTNKTTKVRGLLNILHSYKFTIAENTPYEEEVALDPELLGRVFENLLASYNPETRATARKQTGSFYTPREIVNYMVDEALIASLETTLYPYSAPNSGSAPLPLNSGGAAGPGVSDPSEPSDDLSVNARLRRLFAYSTAAPEFDEAETDALIQAIDSLKILDPACGSGAFPMGILQKLVYVLGKLDPKNARWRDRQLEKAYAIDEPGAREHAVADILQAFDKNDLDYGRKLYLINTGIYGVDIQPIAMQIAKLRFFISLIIDQRTDETAKNRGVRSLPNLETKFVAANTLLRIDKAGQQTLPDQEVLKKQDALKRVRERHFSARTSAAKDKCREEDKALRAEISTLLEGEGLPHEAALRLAQWDPYDQNRAADFFDPAWMFSVSNGFDITIGNPPYVRADSGEAHLTQCKAIEASKLYETLWEKWDLFIPFIERAYKLLKPNGITSMIVSDAYCHSKYAQKSQKWFLANSRINRLDFFTNVQIFDAAVRNVIYRFQRAEGAANKPERHVHDPEFGAVRLLPTAPQVELEYRAFFPEDGDKQIFSRPTLPIDQICYISVGMVVHANEKGSKGAFELQDLVTSTRDEIHSKAFVEGKNLARWLPNSQKWLEWGTERAPALFRRPTFPELYSVPEKLMSVDMSAGVGSLRVSYDNAKLYHNHSIWSFVPWHSLSNIRNNSIKKVARYKGEKPPRPDLPKREDLEKVSRRFAVKYLLGVMNSSAACDFLRANRRSNIHLYPDDWKKLPIPDATPAEQASIVEIVDAILAAKRANPAADISAQEAEIDSLVNALYGLAPETIADVEPTAATEKESDGR